MIGISSRGVSGTTASRALSLGGEQHRAQEGAAWLESTAPVPHATGSDIDVPLSLSTLPRSFLLRRL